MRYLLLAALIMMLLPAAAPASGISVFVGSPTVPGFFATDHCFSSPGACGFPDPAYGTVGVPAGTTLIPSTLSAVNTPGTVVDGLDITGSGLAINANNVTIQNSRISMTSGGCAVGNCGASVLDVNCNCTTTFSHVEITGNAANAVKFGVRNDGGGVANLDHVYHHGYVDMMCWCQNSTIVDSYSIIAQQAVPDDHLENIYGDGATQTITHNTLFNTQDQTATSFGNTNNGVDGLPCTNQFDIENNLLAGGGRILQPCAHASDAGTSAVTIKTNRFARCGGGVEVSDGFGGWVCPGGPDANGYYPRGGIYSLCASIPSTAVISANVWDDTSTSANAACT